MLEEDVKAAEKQEEVGEETPESAEKPEEKAEAKETKGAADQKPKVTKSELLKMPLPKLREVALGIEGLEGVHGMTKDELIRKVAAHYKIDLSDRPELQVDTRAIKAKIKELRPLLAEAREKGDKKRAEILRKRIKRLKRKIRWR
ncbi:MAG TPA: transcription termination factor Rho [Proteobacteria bacterium]|nr:transcription termination factor Rho [Pseudomonadota bacterium]